MNIDDFERINNFMFEYDEAIRSACESKYSAEIVSLAIEVADEVFDHNDYIDNVDELIPAGHDPEAHDLADVFDGEEGLEICGDAVCICWVECWTLDDDGDCIAVDNVEAKKLDEI